MSKLTDIDTCGVTAIWGGRGAGKSYFAKTEIFPQLKNGRILVIDPQADGGCLTALEVSQKLYAGERRIILKTGNHYQAFAAIYAAWAHSTKDNPIYIICDEAPEYFKTTTDRMSIIMYQGRHRALGMCLMGQQPTAMDSFVREQAADTFWMRLAGFRNIQNAAYSLGPKVAKGLEFFKQGQFIRHPPIDENTPPPPNTNEAPKEPEWE